MTTNTINPRVLTILRDYTTVDGLLVRLTCGQLDRKTYEAVNEVLSRLGGKWKGGRTAAHVFDRDPAPLLATALDTEELPPKNPLAFFATPAPLAARMVRLAQLYLDCPVLEPSAGEGAICDAVRDAWPSALIAAIELDPVRAERLQAKGYVVWRGDFLTFGAPAAGYARVLMNPPFATPGDPLAYITHIRHAWSMTANGGRLVAIAPSGFTFRQDRRSREFRELVESNGDWELNGSEAFHASGIDSATAVLWMEK